MGPALRWALAALLAPCLAACQDSEPPAAAERKLKSGPRIEMGEDGLGYEQLEDGARAAVPFTGTTRRVDKTTRSLSYECDYQEGKKHGWEKRWFTEGEGRGRLSKQTTWVRGEPMFHWIWWPNGNLREASSQREGSDMGRPDIAYGSYVKWFEDGTIKFAAHYDEDFFFHGKVLDYGDNKELLVDAVFDHGIYKGGFRASEPAPTPPATQAKTSP